MWVFLGGLSMGQVLSKCMFKCKLALPFQAVVHVFLQCKHIQFTYIVGMGCKGVDYMTASMKIKMEQLHLNMDFCVSQRNTADSFYPKINCSIVIHSIRHLKCWGNAFKVLSMTKSYLVIVVVERSIISPTIINLTKDKL